MAKLDLRAVMGTLILFAGHSSDLTMALQISTGTFYAHAPTEEVVSKGAVSICGLLK